MTSKVRYGWFGDDFTGATDTLATIAERGYRAFLFLDAPDKTALNDLGPLDAIGIASATRTMDNDTMAAPLDRAGLFFQECGCEILHYKCCSTFDSAAGKGNLVTAARSLVCQTGQDVVPVIGGQPSLGRYCTFSNLFAAFKEDVFRLDRHPVMRNHPSTPMDEADLTQHLKTLGATQVKAVTWPELETKSPTEISKRLELAAPEFLVFDAMTSEHIDRIGQVLRQADRPIAVLGASSVAEAWFSETADIPEKAQPSLAGPVLGVSGSLSQVTRLQVAAAKSFEKLEVSPATVASDRTRTAIVERAADLLASGNNVLVTSSAQSGPNAISSKTGFAEQCGKLVQDILERAPIRRLAIAGGDTSSAVMQQIDIWGLEYRGRFGRGICVCTSRSDLPKRNGMEVLLKGGQMGTETLFDDFAAAGKGRAE